MNQERLRRPSHLIIRTARLLMRAGELRLQPLGLSTAQLPVIGTLLAKEAATQKELAAVASIEQPTMAQLLGRMERDGLIQRAPNPDDGRSSLVSLTPLALSKLPEAEEILRVGNAEALDGFSEAEIEALCDFLRRIIANTEAMLREDEPGESIPSYRK